MDGAVFDGDNEFAQALFVVTLFGILVCLLMKRCIRVKTRQQYVINPAQAMQPQQYVAANFQEIPLNPYTHHQGRQYAPQAPGYLYQQQYQH